MLKFTRMQAEVMKFIIDLRPVPARYSNLYSVFYIWWRLFPFVYVYVVTLLVNSFILSLSGAFFLFIFTQQLYILSSTFSYNKLNYSITNLLKFIYILGNVINSYLTLNPFQLRKQINVFFILLWRHLFPFVYVSMATWNVNYSFILSRTWTFMFILYRCFSSTSSYKKSIFFFTNFHIILYYLYMKK